jgi:hypothetical protein
MFRKTFFFCFLCLIVFGCNNNGDAYNNKIGIEPSVIAEMDTAHYTIIQWKDTLNNFGTIKTGDSAHLKFQFTNIGKTPLFILNTRTSCGCTVTDFPKDPVMPGNSGFIRVTYKSGAQTGEINKTITVIANTKKSKNSSLIIRGTVQAAANNTQQ